MLRAESKHAPQRTDQIAVAPHGAPMQRRCRPSVVTVRGSVEEDAVVATKRTVPLNEPQPWTSGWPAEALPILAE
jgi:hypothetical protein